MHLTVELGYNEVLGLVRQLSGFDQQRLSQELGENQRTRDRSDFSSIEMEEECQKRKRRLIQLLEECPVCSQEEIDLQNSFRNQFLLTFPVLDEESINKMLDAKEEIDQCHLMFL